MLKGVDCLPMAKPDATIHSEIRRDCRMPFYLVSRSLVVFNEGSDLRPYGDGVKRPEMCENEVQGVPSVGLSRYPVPVTGEDVERSAEGCCQSLGFNCHGTKLPPRRLVLCHGSVAVTAGTRFGT